MGVLWFCRVGQVFAAHLFAHGGPRRLGPPYKTPAAYCPPRIMHTAHTPQAERRKHVRLRKRPDLTVTAQRYEGRTFHVVKEPINLKYFRFNEQEYFIFSLLDGRKTLQDIHKAFETRFRPDRLTLEDLEVFARSLVTNGLVQHESPNAGRQLYEKRVK